MFKVNGIEIKNPSTFKKERYNITDMYRLASGYMVGDLIAPKRKYYFTYTAISQKDLDTILEAIWSAKIFFTLVYDENGKEEEAEVYVGSIPSELHNAEGSQWVWKNLTFNLIER
ncbi:MAG: hypothetical protein R3Y58_01870 [Eubacteriales bacterium]